MSANDPKFDFEVGRLVSRDSGPVPFDEPVFILRARDRHAAAAISVYASFCHDAGHREAVLVRYGDFVRFALKYPARMKEPDTAPPAQDGEPERCPICDEPKVEGQLMLTDISLGEVHAACCGPERESYVNLETGDPIGPDEPIPVGYPYKREG